jgi:hypothetical protein
MCRRDRFSCAIVRMNAAEEQQIFAAMRIEGESPSRASV